MSFFKNKLAVTVIVLSVSFLILIGISVKRKEATTVENGVGITLNSVQSIIYTITSKTKSSIEFVFSFTKVKTENERLKEENDKLQAQSAEFDSLKAENERLRDMLNFKDQRSEYNYIGAHIVSTSGGNYLDSFAIDKGTQNGIQKGMVAITTGGVLVGQVSSVAGNWAIVQTLANENIAVSGMVESTKENSGIVKGYKDEGNTVLAKLYHLPLESNVKIGDAILTSGVGGIYPKGIRIGYVTDVEEDKGKVMKNAIIKPIADFNKLEEVFIIVPQNTREIKY